jgi:hypothetical protein
MKKDAVTIVVALLLMLSQRAMAQEIWQIEKQVTSLEVHYLSGHVGDINYIQGAIFDADIYYNGSKIGTCAGSLLFLNPPLDFNARYAPAAVKYVNTIPGNGSYQVNAQGIGFFTSDIYSGKGTVAFSGSISNGTDNLESMVGLASAIGEFDLVKQTGVIEETISVRMGY